MRTRRSASPAKHDVAKRSQSSRGSVPARAPRWRVAAVVVISIGFVAAVFAMWRAQRSQPPIHADRSNAPSDSLAHLTLVGANKAAIDLVHARRYTESLPYFRREFELLDRDSWGLHLDYGTMLFNSTFQMRTIHGLPTRVTRSTLERVALVREGLAELDRSERLASKPAEFARTRERRAHILWAWGFYWDAIEHYASALRADPNQVLARRLRERVDQLQVPSLPNPDDEVPQGP